MELREGILQVTSKCCMDNFSDVVRVVLDVGGHWTVYLDLGHSGNVDRIDYEQCHFRLNQF